jgi:type IX secretion system PorP/SprF family membrane protein
MERLTQLKRIKITVIVLVISACVPWYALGQQKVQFTQYMFNGLIINPAYAGTEEALSLSFIHRSQWTGIENAPTTQTFSGHTLMRNKRVGLGLTVVNDKIGVHKNLNASGNYAYHLKLKGKNHLSFGLSAGIYSRKSDYASLVGTVDSDPKLFNPYISNVFFNAGAGVYFRNDRVHLGISVPELIPERITINDSLSLSIDNLNYLLFAKYKIGVSRNVVAEPGLMVKYFSGVPLSFDVNLNFIFQQVLTLGISYRKQESIDVMVKCQASAQLQFGYAYDYPTGHVARSGNGSHEIFINYLFRYFESNVKSPR